MVIDVYELQAESFYERTPLLQTPTHQIPRCCNNGTPPAVIILPDSVDGPVLVCVRAGPTQRSADSRRRCTRISSFLTSLFDQLSFWSIFALCILSATSSMWIIFRPQEPEFDVVEARVSGIRVYREHQVGVRHWGLVVEVNLSMRVAVTNPNRVGVFIEGSTTKILYRGRELGEAQLAGGRQPRLSSWQVNVSASVNSRHVEGLEMQLLADVLERRVPLGIHAHFRGCLELPLVRPKWTATVDCQLSADPILGSVVEKTCDWTYTL